MDVGFGGLQGVGGSIRLVGGSPNIGMWYIGVQIGIPVSWNLPDSFPGLDLEFEHEGLQPEE